MTRAMDGKENIREFDYDQLVDLMVEWGEPSYRADQMYEWLWKRYARDFKSMSNLPKDLRSRLEDSFVIQAIEEHKMQQSEDGTVKTRFRLHDGHLIESVLIPVPDQERYTACVSSQVGCSLACHFCATGTLKYERNLDAGEIYDQVVKVNEQSERIFDHPLTNLVYMGMGEPLLTYRPVLQSIYRITGEAGLNWSPSRITVSTVGIAKMIEKLADDDPGVNLALSLHAANDDKRSEIMPINESNDIDSLMEALKYYYRKTRKPLTYEYIAFDQFNDTEEDAIELAELCRAFPVKVNIIQYNPVPGLEFEGSGLDRIDRMARILRDRRIPVTVRRSRGKDIDAACGQLANQD